MAEQNLRGCTTLIQVRKVAELDWRDFPTNLPTFVPTFVLGNIYKWLICICILIDFEARLVSLRCWIVDELLLTNDKMLTKLC